MKKILCLLSATIFSLGAIAQVASITAMAVKEGKVRSHSKYLVLWTCAWNAGGLARDSLKKEGYTDAQLTTLGQSVRENGYFTVVKNNKKESSGEIRCTYGFGVDSTAEAALVAAVKNLGSNNWSWNTSDGYEVVETQRYFCCKHNVVAVTTVMDKPTACGESRLKSYSISLTNTSDKKFQLINSPQVKQYFVAANHESAVLELVFLCSPDSQYYSQVKIITAKTKEELEKLIILEYFSEQYSNLVEIKLLAKSTDKSETTALQLILQHLRKRFDEECKKNPERCKKRKSSSIGVRG